MCCACNPNNNGCWLSNNNSATVVTWCCHDVVTQYVMCYVYDVWCCDVALSCCNLSQHYHTNIWNKVQTIKIWNKALWYWLMHNESSLHLNSLRLLQTIKVIISFDMCCPLTTPMCAKCYFHLCKFPRHLLLKY